MVTGYTSGGGAVRQSLIYNEEGISLVLINQFQLFLLLYVGLGESEVLSNPSEP